MITEGYFAQIKNYPEDEIKVCVAFKYPWFVKKDKMIHMISLAPTEQLLKKYKEGRWTWIEYHDRYWDEFNYYHDSPEDLKKIKKWSDEGKNVRLLCYEKALDRKCHRFILLEILKLWGSKVQSLSRKVNTNGNKK